jgi:hypothetical protein
VFDKVFKVSILILAVLFLYLHFYHQVGRYHFKDEESEVIIFDSVAGKIYVLDENGASVHDPVRDSIDLTKMKAAEAKTARKWAEVINSPGYQGLPYDRKVAAQEQYFNEVVVPQLADKNDIPRAKKQFYKKYPIPTK